MPSALPDWPRSGVVLVTQGAHLAVDQCPVVGREHGVDAVAALVGSSDRSAVLIPLEEHEVVGHRRAVAADRHLRVRQAVGSECYRSHNGRLFAETPLDSEDIIINDAGSLVEVLAKHEKMLPLALTAREIRAKPGNLHVTGLEVDR